jgi:hypothetical protein
VDACGCGGNEKDTFLQVTVQSSKGVTDAVTKRRGENIISMFKKAGVNLEIKLNYTKGNIDAVSIVSQPKL